MTKIHHDHELKYLRKALRVFYPDPGLALHRAVEAKMFSKSSLVSPILELGCGDGSFSYLCYGSDELKHNERVSSTAEDKRLSNIARPIDIGLDLVSNTIREAKSKGIYKNVVVADINNLPFKNQLFKTIISNSVMTHIYHLDNALNEIARILHPEGKFVFTAPSKYFGDYLFSTQIWKALGLRSIAKFFSRKYNKKYGQYHFLKLSEWQSRLEAVGMRLEEDKYYLSGKASFVWSLFFELFRVGFKRLTFAGLLRKISLFLICLNLGIHKEILLNLWEKILHRYYQEEPEVGGSVFLIAKKAN